MKKLVLCTVLLTLCITGCGVKQPEHKLVGIGNYKYDNINGLLYTKNNYDEWVATGQRIFFVADFKGE